MFRPVRWAMSGPVRSPPTTPRPTLTARHTSASRARRRRSATRDARSPPRLRRRGSEVVVQTDGQAAGAFHGGLGTAERVNTSLEHVPTAGPTGPGVRSAAPVGYPSTVHRFHRRKPPVRATVYLSTCRPCRELPVGTVWTIGPAWPHRLVVDRWLPCHQPNRGRRRAHPHTPGQSIFATNRRVRDGRRPSDGLDAPTTARLMWGSAERSRRPCS